MSTSVGAALETSAEPAPTLSPFPTAGPWRVHGVSVAGSKRSADEPCEDSHRWVVTGQWLIAAVADGAGSAARAAEGAAQAASFVVEHCAWLLEEQGEVSADLIGDSFQATHRSLDRLRLSEQAPLADFATTLTVVVAGKDEVWAAQVGDGAVVVRDDDGLVALAETSKGEFLNETTFLTSRSWRKELSIERLRVKASALALLTDGLGMLALDLGSGVPHDPFFSPVFAFCSGDSDDAEVAEGLERFLRSDRVGTRTDDDVTLLIALPA